MLHARSYRKSTLISTSRLIKIKINKSLLQLLHNASGILSLVEGLLQLKLGWVLVPSSSRVPAPWLDPPFGSLISDMPAPKVHPTGTKIMP